MTTVALRAAAAASENVTTPSLPAGTVAGDFILVIVHQSGAASTPSAAGYTQFATYTDSAANSRTTVLYRTATGSDSITLVGAGSSFVTYVSSYTGVRLDNPFADSASVESPNFGPFVCPSVSSSRTGNYLVCHIGGATYGGIGPVTWTPPSGMTERLDYSGTDSTFPYANTAADLAGVTGTTGSKTFTPSNTNIGNVVGISLLLATANLAPTAPTSLSPAGATTINRANTRRFSWTFNDPDTGDSQSKFDLQYRVDTGAWTAVTQTTTNRFWDAAGGTFPAGDYEWQVRTYDALGVVGPWSASAFFTAADAPGVPTITAPTDGTTISTTTAAFSWSTPSQQAYRVRKVADDGAGNPDTGTVYYDSGEITSTSARSVTLDFDTNGRDEHLQLQVEDAGLWSAWASVHVTVSFTPPAVPSLTVAPDSAAGSIVLTPSIPAPGAGEPTVTAVEVYRRVTADGGDGIRIAAGLPPGSAWTDWTPASGVDYGYQLVAVGDNGTTSSSTWTS